MKKIGIIDSGIGGLTLLREFIHSAYSAEYFYISDESNVPYGGKTQQFMYERTQLMVEKLMAKNVETIVLACNTLTAETIDKLRSNYSIKFIGIEPYINYQNKVESIGAKKLGLILTPATYASNRFKELQTKFDPDGKIVVLPLENLALLIEKLKYDSSEKIYLDLKNELKPLKELDLSHLILGCTHYPIIKELIERELNVIAVDPNKQVSQHLSNLLGLSKSKYPVEKFNYNFDLSDVWQYTSLKDFGFF
jgi:glutamate racemase